MSRGFRLHPWNCWGLIIASWAILAVAHYHAMAELERVMAEVREEFPIPPPRVYARPPRVLIAISCGVVALFLATTLCRRGRAWLRIRPRLSRPSKDSHTYLEAFAAQSGLRCIGVGCLVFIGWYWTPLHYLGMLGSVLAVLYVFWRERSIRVPLAEWGWTRGRAIWREVSIGVLLGLFFTYARFLPRGVFGVDDSLGAFTLFLSVGWAPIVEETLYRGMLYRYLRDHWRWPVAVLISSVVFAAMHLPHQRWPQVFVAGVVYALLREWRGSLLAPVAAHAAGNLLAELTQSGAITW